jgi:orotate phosphoribosyltransferase
LEDKFLQEYSDALISERVLALFKEYGAYLDTEETGDHYLLPSGSHSSRFYNPKPALQYRDICELLTLVLFRKLARFRILELINTVVGPEKGADPLIYMLLHYLPETKVRAISFKKVGKDEEEKDIFLPPEGIQIGSKDFVLVVDDVFDTGGSVKSVIESCGDACVLGVACCINRAPEKWSPFPSWSTIPIVWGLRDPVIKYSAGNCPYCVNKVPLVKV